MCGQLFGNLEVGSPRVEIPNVKIRGLFPRAKGFDVAIKVFACIGASHCKSLLFEINTCPILRQLVRLPAQYFIPRQSSFPIIYFSLLPYQPENFVVEPRWVRWLPCSRLNLEVFGCKITQCCFEFGHFTRGSLFMHDLVPIILPQLSYECPSRSLRVLSLGVG